MKAGHLSRKTHFKKHAVLPSARGDGDVLDLTSSENDIPAAHSLIAPRQSDYDETIARPYAFQTAEDVFMWCAAVLAESPLAARLLQDALDKGWNAGLTDLNGGGYYLDTENRILLMDHFSLTPSALGRSMYFRNAFLTTFIRALRDIWQEERFGAFERDYAPEHVLMLERARAADGDTVAILAGWELRGAGFTDIWRHLLGSEEGDMALIFTRFLERDPTALFDGSALAYAFRQWYADRSRVDHSDHAALEILDGILLEADGANSFGAREMRADIVESLSRLPDGTCYLAGLGLTIMGDPFFAGMNDPINQTHLFHLMYDMEVTMVNNVPFRDAKLARMIFPGAETVRAKR
jgi:hypothetical protein